MHRPAWLVEVLAVRQPTRPGQSEPLRKGFKDEEVTVYLRFRVYGVSRVYRGFRVIIIHSNDGHGYGICGYRVCKVVEVQRFVSDGYNAISQAVIIGGTYRRITRLARKYPVATFRGITPRPIFITTRKPQARWDELWGLGFTV